MRLNGLFRQVLTSWYWPSMQIISESAITLSFVIDKRKFLSLKPKILVLWFSLL